MNVVVLLGVVRVFIVLLDVYSGYGFAIGNVVAFDCGDDDVIVLLGGVGFDINCGVWLL